MQSIVQMAIKPVLIGAVTPTALHERLSTLDKQFGRLVEPPHCSRRHNLRRTGQRRAGSSDRAQQGGDPITMSLDTSLPGGDITSALKIARDESLARTASPRGCMVLPPHLTLPPGAAIPHTGADVHHRRR
jgi:hypothetical protein